MDYFGIIKRGWEIAWRHKALWVLGLFAASGGGSVPSGSGSGYQYGGSGSSGDLGDLPFAKSLEQAARWMEQNVEVLLVVGAFLGLLALVFFVLGIAARGGLVHLVNEAEEGRAVSPSDGWSVGFRRWGRTFMIGLLSAAPFIVLAAALAAVLVPVAAVTSVTALGGLSPDSWASGDGQGLIAAGSAFLCCGLPLLAIAFAVLGVLMAIVVELGIRYGVLYDMTFGKAFVQGWRDVWAKRGSVVMWLVMLLPGLVYGIVVGAIALVALVPALLAIREGSLAPLIAIVGLLFLVMLVPSALYGTFVSASWTVFFRRMTGLEPPVAAPVSPYGAPGAYPAPPGTYPPAPAPGAPQVPPSAPLQPSAPPVSGPQASGAPEPPVPPAPPAADA